MSKIFHPLLLFLILAGCERPGDLDLVQNIEEEFLLEMKEVLNPAQQSEFNFLTSVIEPVPCENSSLITDKSFVNNQIDLKVLNLVIPDNCVDGAYHPNAWFPIESLTKGIYPFAFRLPNGVHNEGILNVFEDAYSLTLYSTDGMILANSRLQKIPRNHIWGVIHSEYDPLLENELISRLKSIGEHSFLKAGFYGYFSISPDRTLVIEDFSNKKYKPFLMKFDDEHFEKVYSIYEDYKSQYGSSVEMKLFTSTGEVWE